MRNDAILKGVEDNVSLLDRVHKVCNLDYMLWLYDPDPLILVAYPLLMVITMSRNITLTAVGCRLPLPRRASYSHAPPSYLPVGPRALARSTYLVLVSRVEVDNLFAIVAGGCCCAYGFAAITRACSSWADEEESVPSPSEILPREALSLGLVGVVAEGGKGMIS